ncbi:MAG: MFS transporter [Actinomycetota bacterium]
MEPVTKASDVRRRTAALVLSGSVLLALAGGLVRVGLPSIRRDLSAGIAAMQAVSMAGLVVTTATVVAFGHLADLMGARSVYAAGLVAFAAGYGVDAVAPSVGWLVAGQAVTGLGWAMCVGSGAALLVSTFEATERGRILSAHLTANALGMAAGPGLGGLVVQGAGWRLGLAMLIPPALLLAALMVRSLPARSNDSGDTAARGAFDLIGAASLAGALAGLVLLISGSGEADLPHIRSPALMVVILVFGAVFVRAEMRAPRPLLDLRMFNVPGFSAGLGASFLNFIAMASNMFLMPFFLQDLLGESPSRAGLVMMAVPVAIAVFAPLAGVATDRYGSRGPATFGEGMVAAAVVLMAALGRESSLWSVASVLALYGLGAAFFHSPNNSGVMGSAPPDRAGVAAASLGTFARIGEAAGVAIAGGLWRAGLEHNATAPAGAEHAFQQAFLVLGAVGLVAALVSWSRGRAPRRQPMDPVEESGRR